MYQVRCEAQCNDEWTNSKNYYNLESHYQLDTKEERNKSKPSHSTSNCVNFFLYLKKKKSSYIVATLLIVAFSKLLNGNRYKYWQQSKNFEGNKILFGYKSKLPMGYNIPPLKVNAGYPSKKALYLQRQQSQPTIRCISLSIKLLIDP